MSLRARVLIRLLESGQPQPIEVWPGTVLGHTSFHPDHGYVYEFEVEEFNRRARDLFIMKRAPGHEYIPMVLVECGSDNPDFVPRSQHETLKAENERLKEEIAELLVLKHSTLLPEAFPEGVTSEEPIAPPVIGGDEDTPTLTVDAIKAKMDERKWQTSTLAPELGVSKEALIQFIQDHEYDFHLAEKGGWINRGPKPKGPLDKAA